MDALMSTLKSAPLLIISILIEYRLPRKALKLKYSPVLTFSVMYVVKCFAGWVNLSFHVAKDIGGNALYYGFTTLLMYILFFHGSLIKKVFLTSLIVCGASILFYVSLPFAHFFYEQTTSTFLLVLKILETGHTLLCAVCMEYIGKKFQNLRRELPADYTIYLTAVIIFVYIATYSAYDRVLIINEGVLSLPTALTLAAFAIAGVVIVVIAIFAVDRQVNVSLQEHLHAMQAENFKNRELEWRRFSGFRHDINNHLICLDGLLQSEKTEQAILYMQKLTDTMKQFDNPVHTGNDYADALLSVKYAEALAAKIDISIEMSIPPSGFIDPVDLCCILSNAFDNAIAACNRLTEGARWIKARAFIRQGQLVVEIKNSKPPYVSVTDGEVFPKEITADHGLGLDNVKAVVQKYGGVLDLCADDVFSFSVLLPELRL